MTWAIAIVVPLYVACGEFFVCETDNLIYISNVDDLYQRNQKDVWRTSHLEPDLIFEKFLLMFGIFNMNKTLTYYNMK